MPGATLPGDEAARLLDLARYRILHVPPEAALDRLTHLVAQALCRSVVGINFIETHQQWNKSRFGSPDPTGSRMDLLEARVQRAEFEQAAKEAHQAARQDVLTGVLNRRAFDEDLAAIAMQLPFTLAMVDIDGLKAINDTVGHAQGDQVIQTFAQALALFIRPLGRMYRIGGDEFAMILNPLPKKQIQATVQEAAERTLTRSPGQVGASVGVADSSEDQEV